MRRADIIGSIITIMIGLFAVSQSMQIEYWWKFGPGPGFLPLWASLIMIFGGCLLLVQALRKKKSDKQRSGPQQTKRIGNVVVVGSLTVLTAIVMIYLGFNIAIFLFMAIMVHMLGKYRWYITLGTAAAVTISFYILFAVWLQVPLPKGFWEFL